MDDLDPALSSIVMPCRNAAFYECDMRQDQVGPIQHAGADVNGIGAVAEIDGKGLYMSK